jgi:hypothetical protein
VHKVPFWVDRLKKNKQKKTKKKMPKEITQKKGIRGR